jgi:hypothetical protein
VLVQLHRLLHVKCCSFAIFNWTEVVMPRIGTRKQGAPARARRARLFILHLFRTSALWGASRREGPRRVCKHFLNLIILHPVLVVLWGPWLTAERRTASEATSSSRKRPTARASLILQLQVTITARGQRPCHPSSPRGPGSRRENRGTRQQSGGAMNGSE